MSQRITITIDVEDAKLAAESLKTYVYSLRSKKHRPSGMSIGDLVDQVTACQALEERLRRACGDAAEGSLL